MADPQITSNGIASQSGRLSLKTKFLGACILRLSDEFRTPGAAFAEMNMIATLCEEQNYTTQELLIWGEANLKIAKKWSPGVRELTGIPRSLNREKVCFIHVRRAEREWRSRGFTEYDLEVLTDAFKFHSMRYESVIITP